MCPYHIIQYYSKTDECYLAFCPELPGCFADGKTPEDAHENITKVQEEWVKTAIDTGMDIPVPQEKFESSNPSILDVANYVLAKCGNISALALQKLTYYCLAWCLAWYETALFPEKFHAWKKGPVSLELWEHHKGHRIVAKEMFPSGHIFTNAENQVMDDVIAVYADEDAGWLSDLTHSERPWKETRSTLSDDMPSNKEIPNALIQEYYQTMK